MKKIICLAIFLLGCIFCFNTNVFATKFYEGDYISGEYISKVKDGKIYYLTMKFIKDNNGNVLYCMEPFVKFYEDYDYSKNGNYNNYDSSVLRKVELLTYYGYGYKNRTSSKWYVITQYLIWKTVSSNDIYFTDTLNGKRITKYSSEMNELLSDVNKHDINNLIMNYEVDYKDDLILDLIGYEVVNSDYEIKDNVIYDIKENGTIRVSKVSNNYKNNIAIYDGNGSQDLILRGNVKNSVYDIKVSVLKGNIIFRINTDEIVDDYQVCYLIYKDTEVVDNLCTDSNLEYKSIDLSYGNYKVIQSSISDGYEIDSNVYDINLTDSFVLELDNKIIRNNLNVYKYYCENDLCIKESNALFIVYDLLDNYVGEIRTDEYGYGSISLKYGEYKIKQINGMDGYSLVEDFNVVIKSNIDEYSYCLYNNKIVEEEFLIPNTGIQGLLGELNYRKDYES